jgi:hypothetical protein
MLSAKRLPGKRQKISIAVREHPGAFERRRKTRTKSVEKGQREDPTKVPASVIH